MTAYIPPYSPSLQDWQRQVSAALNPALGKVQAFESYASYFALGQLLQNMRADTLPFRTRLGRFSDVYSDATGINAGASQYYDHDATRFVVGTQRFFKNSVAPEEDFEDISDWTVNIGAAVIDPLDPDPAVGKCVELDTGAIAGDQATLRKYFGVIPATFGVTVMTEMGTTLTSSGEALEIQAQNNQGHLLRMRVYSGAVDFFRDGAWHTLFAYGGGTTGFTEWWFDAAHISGSNYTIRLFAGTQELPGFTGVLPNGTVGEDGYVNLIQYSSGTNHRRGRVAVLQVGSSALPANMSLVSVTEDVVTEPSTVSMAVMFEDVCLQTVVGTDLRAWISKDGGATYYEVTLTNFDELDAGVLTTSCPVYLLAGTVALPMAGAAPHSVCCKITSANGRYFSLNGVAWRVDA